MSKNINECLVCNDRLNYVKLVEQYDILKNKYDVLLKDNKTYEEQITELENKLALNEKRISKLKQANQSFDFISTCICEHFKKKDICVKDVEDFLKLQKSKYLEKELLEAVIVALDLLNIDVKKSFPELYKQYLIVKQIESKNVKKGEKNE